MSAPDPNTIGDTLKRAADAATPNSIDVDEVLRRSRARRRARRTAVLSTTGAVAAVLAVGGLVFGLQRVGGPTTADAPAMEAAESADAATDAATGGAPADESQRLMAPGDVNRCGAAVAAATDAATSPLAVSVDAPAAPVRPGTNGPAIVTVTNSGTDIVTGTLHIDAPLTVAESGVTVSNGGPVPDVGPLPIDLAPGESATLPGSFETRSCDPAVEGDTAPSALAPPLEPGDYGLSAIVTFIGPDGAISYLISPLAPFTVG
jgi:hypothetical protein